MKLKDYYRAQTIDEVVALINKSRKNVILGGSHWLGLGQATYNLGIDISELGLGEIGETDHDLEIGGNVSLRQLETNPTVARYAGILAEAVSGIVGVQFRNTARIGASVYSRFGFSDITAALLTLDAVVEIDGEKRLAMDDYLSMPKQRHFVTRIIIKKENLRYSYQAMRRNKTDIPYLIVAMSLSHGNLWRISVGARPGKSRLAYKTMAYLGQGGRDIDEATSILLEEVGFCDNIHASEAYRRHLASVFLGRGIRQLWK